MLQNAFSPKNIKVSLATAIAAFVLTRDLRVTLVVALVAYLATWLL